MERSRLGNNPLQQAPVRASCECRETFPTEPVQATEAVVWVQGALTCHRSVVLYNVPMNQIALHLMVVLVTGCASLALAIGEEPTPQPSAKDRLQQILDAEGGTHVYMDAAGNVHSTTDLPNGDRIISVQPPQIPGLNLGPPLQLNNRTLEIPQPPPVPAQPPPPEYPQRAR